MKSRLVGCGNFEETEGLRTDSPTGDVDAHNLVFSWCASSKVKIMSADISSAYLQGKQNEEAESLELEFQKDQSLQPEFLSTERRALADDFGYD